MASQNLLILGRVVGAWGIRGAVRVRSFTDLPGLVSRGQSVILRGRRGESEVILDEIRPLKHLVVARFQGIENRDTAEALKGYDICIPRGLAPRLPDASYYHYDILGLLVQTEAGEKLGEIVDIWPSDAHDWYVVRRDGKEWLLPAVRAFILEVDLTRRVMVVRPIGGLVDTETL